MIFSFRAILQCRRNTNTKLSADGTRKEYVYDQKSVLVPCGAPACKGDLVGVKLRVIKRCKGVAKSQQANSKKGEEK